jgi:hypothetical protein
VKKEGRELNLKVLSEAKSTDLVTQREGRGWTIIPRLQTWTWGVDTVMH